jgi:hypothetical protein
MIIRAQIIPMTIRGNVSIVGSYRDKDTDREYFLNSSGKKVTTSLEEGDKIFQHAFLNGAPLTIIIDTDDFSQKAVIDFWKKHPLVKTDGFRNKNFIAEQFKFLIREEQVSIDYDALVSKLEVISIVSGMTTFERFNLCFALGGDPREMNEKEVFLYLIGLTLTGIAIAKKEEVKNFITIKHLEREATIYANKAVSYGVISKEGSVYKVGGRNLGSSIDSVYAMILSDSDLYENYIKPEVDKREKEEIVVANLENELDIPEEIINLLPVGSALEKKRVAKTTGK